VTESHKIDGRSINKRQHESSWKIGFVPTEGRMIEATWVAAPACEEAIGSVPKGLKKGSAA